MDMPNVSRKLGFGQSTMKDRNLVSVAAEPAHHVRPDKLSSTDHQNTHLSTSFTHPINAAQDTSMAGTLPGVPTKLGTIHKI